MVRAAAGPPRANRGGRGVSRKILPLTSVLRGPNEGTITQGRKFLVMIEASRKLQSIRKVPNNKKETRPKGKNDVFGGKSKVL